MSGSSFRLRVLALHLNGPAFPSDASQDVNTQASSISQQECAAVCTLKFARPAAPADVLFAVPAAEVPSSARLEALGAANDTIESIRNPATTPVPAFPFFVLSKEDSSPPLYARPEISNALLTSNQEDEGTTTLPASSSKPFFLPQSSEGGVNGEKNEEKSLVAASGHWAPQASVIENEFGYVLQAVLPGVNAKEVRAELHPGRRLVITGIRHQQSATDNGGGGGGGGARPALFSILPEVFGEPGLNKVVYGGHVLQSGRFRLVWKLPKDANQESIRADFKDGCLLVRVTKESVFSLF